MEVAQEYIVIDRLVVLLLDKKYLHFRKVQQNTANRTDWMFCSYPHTAVINSNPLADQSTDNFKKKVNNACDVRQLTTHFPQMQYI